MASMNKVFIMGRLGFDPETRYTSGQTAVTTLRIATSESWVKDGQRQEQTEWHRVVVWGKQAENCAKYLAKGRQVFVEGRLQTRAWDDKTGQKRYTTEINASSVQFIGGGANASGPTATAGHHDGGEYQEPRFQQESRFPQADNHGAPLSYGGGSSHDSAVNFDDIPF